MTEEHPYNNFTFYGASKIAGEHFFKSSAIVTNCPGSVCAT